MPGPLFGVTVLDFSRLLPGPFATLLMADLGADVVRVVSPRHPDLVEALPPFVRVDGSEVSAVAAWLHRGKRAVVLDLGHPRGREVAWRLAARVDVLVEQFRPGVMARLGLDAPRLLAAYPSLVYASLSGYGQTGPLASRAGHDINYVALAGLLSYCGTRVGGPPPLGMQVADLAGASNLVIGVLAALLHRGRTGQGQHVDVAMLDAALSWTAMAGAASLAGGEDPGRESHLLSGGSLYGCYETADGAHLAFGGLEPGFFKTFCEAIGRPDLAAGGVCPADVQLAREAVAAAVRTRTRAEWQAVFAGLDACTEPVLSLREAFEQPQARSRRMRLDRKTAAGEALAQVGCPLTFSATTPEPGAPGEPSGPHCRDVLRSFGFSEEELDGLEAAGATRRCEG
jgi:crotonobetainyl-CoA:carnitine CoA-transferase CaiB-like acyl-CoA transferase